MGKTELEQIRDQIEALLASSDRWDWNTANGDRYRRLCAKEAKLLDDSRPWLWNRR